MKNLILLVITSFFLISCVSGRGQPSLNTVCVIDDNRPTKAEIKYKLEVDKKLEMAMKLKFNGEAGNRFEVELKPTGSDSNDVVVSIVGRSGTLPNGDPTSYTWLNGQGSYNTTSGDRNAIILCVPQSPDGTEYKFDVIVGGIGTIDPRFHVTRQ